MKLYGHGLATFQGAILGIGFGLLLWLSAAALLLL